MVAKWLVSVVVGLVLVFEARAVEPPQQRARTLPIDKYDNTKRGTKYVVPPLADELPLIGHIIGKNGRPYRMPAKVLKVIDRRRVMIETKLILIGRGGWWILELPDTSCLKEGQTWEGVDGWAKITGAWGLKVTGVAPIKGIYRHYGGKVNTIAPDCAFKPLTPRELKVLTAAFPSVPEGTRSTAREEVPVPQLTVDLAVEEKAKGPSTRVSDTSKPKLSEDRYAQEEQEAKEMLERAGTRASYQRVLHKYPDTAAGREAQRRLNLLK